MGGSEIGSLYRHPASGKRYRDIALPAGILQNHIATILNAAQRIKHEIVRAAKGSGEKINPLQRISLSEDDMIIASRQGELHQRQALV